MNEISADHITSSPAFLTSGALNGMNVSTSSVDIVACMLRVPSLIISVTQDLDKTWGGYF